MIDQQVARVNGFVVMMSSKPPKNHEKLYFDELLLETDNLFFNPKVAVLLKERQII